MGVKYSFNKNYFDIINTKEKAYWIGFIWSDGYVCKHNKDKYITFSLKLSLSDVDEEHIYKFKKQIESTHIIRRYDISGFKTKNKESRLCISNTHFGNTLYDKYGLIPRRSDILPLIENVPNEFYQDLIRGIFDAEGCVVMKNIKFKKYNRKECSISITTNENILEFINNIFIEKGLTNTKYKLQKRHKDRDGICKTMMITGNNITLKILNWIYEDSDVYLDRKYLKYVEFVKYMNDYKMEVK